MEMKTKELSPLYHVDMFVKNKAHYYDVEDSHGNRTQYPGVTGFLQVINKPALINWAKKEALSVVENILIKEMENDIFTELSVSREWIDRVMEEAKKRPEKIKDEAADLGTQAHAFIDLIINGKEPEEVPVQIKSAVESFKKWWSESGIELIMGDTKVASTLYGYGGSLDSLGKRNGEYVILDWKTGGGIYVEAALQVSAYAQAFMETYGILCKEAIVVRFSKKEAIEFEYKEVLDTSESFHTFLLAKELSESLKVSQWRQ